MSSLNKSKREYSVFDFDFNLKSEYSIDKLYLMKDKKEKPFPYSLLDEKDKIVIREFYKKDSDLIFYNISPSAINQDKVYSNIEIAIEEWNKMNKNRISDIIKFTFSTLFVIIAIASVITNLPLMLLIIILLFIPLIVLDNVSDKIIKKLVNRYAKNVKNENVISINQNNSTKIFSDKVNSIIKRDKILTTINEDIKDIKEALKLIKDKVFVGKARVGLEYCKKSLAYLESNNEQINNSKNLSKNVAKLKKLVFLQLDTQMYESKENDKIKEKSFQILAGINNLLSDSYHDIIDSRKEDILIQLEMIEMENKLDKEYSDF